MIVCLDIPLASPYEESNLDSLILEHTHIYFRICALITRLTEAESMVIRFVNLRRRPRSRHSSRLRCPRPPASHHRMPVPYLW
jgi:hypothetical protein